MKRKNIANNSIEDRREVDVFLSQFILLCKKYNLTFTIKDNQTVVTDYNEKDIEKIKRLNLFFDIKNTKNEPTDKYKKINMKFYKKNVENKT